MEFINDNLWIIFVSILALVAYTKVWNLTKQLAVQKIKAQQTCKRAPTRLTINYVYENNFSGH